MSHDACTSRRPGRFRRRPRRTGGRLLGRRHVRVGGVHAFSFGTDNRTFGTDDRTDVVDETAHEW
jgi:hypothetical protein